MNNNNGLFDDDGAAVGPAVRYEGVFSCSREHIRHQRVYTQERVLRFTDGENSWLLLGLPSRYPRQPQSVTLSPEDWFNTYQINGFVRLMLRNPPIEGQSALYFHLDRPDLVSA